MDLAPPHQLKLVKNSGFRTKITHLTLIGAARTAEEEQVRKETLLKAGRCLR